MLRKTTIVPVLILLNLSAVGFVLGQPDEILMGVITRRSNVDVIPISVYAEEDLMERLLTTAFGSHGAYVMRGAGESDFRFRFSRRGDAMVSLSIESGNPSRVLFSETTGGRDWRDAALRAGDLAVQKTLGIPGFFAGLITFVGDRSGSSEIYVSDVFFENVRRLTNDRVDCISPELSPDGKHLLFTSYFLNGFPDIYRINLSTAERTVFAGFRGSNSGAAYSGSGREVALILSGAGNAELYRCAERRRKGDPATHSHRGRGGSRSLLVAGWKTYSIHFRSVRKAAALSRVFRRREGRTPAHQYQWSLHGTDLESDSSKLDRFYNVAGSRVQSCSFRLFGWGKQGAYEIGWRCSRIGMDE